jgi:hypothetical protein
MAESFKIYPRPRVEGYTMAYYWDAPINNNVSSYNLQITGSDDSVTVALDPGSRMYTVSNADVGQQYTGQIYQINNNELSSIVSDYKTITFGNRPGAPTLVSTFVTGPYNAVIAWQPPTSDGGSQIRNYVIRDTDGRFKIPARAYQNEALTPTLSTGTYTFFVQALNDAGYGTKAFLDTLTVPLRPLVPYETEAGNPGLRGTTGMTTIRINSLQDEGTIEQTLPFTFNFLGTSYTKIFPNSNTYITFGTGGSGGIENWLDLSLTTPRPPRPHLALGATDGQWTSTYTQSGTNYYRWRQEGNSVYNVSAINIIYEITFYRQVNVDDDIYVEFRFGVHGGGAGTFGVSNGLAAPNNVSTDFKSLLSAPAVVPNTSYVLILTPTGQFKQILRGFYVTSVVT